MSVIRCPVHNMTDCSPLLNGCSLVNQIVAEVERGIEARGDTFTATCVRVHRRANVYRSVWRNTSDEGIVTEIAFHYPDCDGIREKVGDTITLTLHTDVYGNALNSSHPVRVSA